MAAGPAWIEAIDLAFVDRRFGAATVDRVLARTGDRYADAGLHVDGAGRLVGALADGREAVVAKVRVDPADGSLAIACTCARGRPVVCDHVMRVLVDVAAHPGVRAALVAGAPTGDRVAELPALRRSLHAERSIDQSLSHWLPPRATDVDLELDVEPVRYTGAPSPEAPPAVLLRFRRSGSRKALGAKEVLAASLPARRRRLVELAVPSQHHRDALVSVRASASLLVELLREEVHARTGGFKRPLRYGREPVAPRIDREADRLVVRWCTAKDRVVCDAADALLFTGPFPFLWSEAHAAFHPVAPEVDLAVAWGYHVMPSIPLSERVAEHAGRMLLGRGRASGVTLPPAEAFGLPPLEAPRFTVRLRGSPLDVRAELAPEDAVDEDALVRAEERLREAGFVDGIAEGDRAIELWERGIERLRTSDDPRFDVVVGEELAGTKVGPPAEVRVDAAAASGWLDVELEFRAGSLTVQMAALREALVRKQRWVVLSDRTLARITDEIAALVEDAGEARLRLPAFHVPRVSRWVEKYGGAMDETASRLRMRLSALSVASEPRLPGRFGATLRPYQRDGVAWLQFLRELGAGGILADDMGLGKTVMTLAFLARLREDEGPAPVLVVCPTSVAGNWRREAERFAPELAGDLVVVTYGRLRREIDALAKTRFRCAVLDEAQNVKNADSATARAARRLDADTRLALSGTPVENRLRELWSLMAFANPGLLGDAGTFDDRFERPIALRPDGAIAGELRAIVRPFVLRRTKAQVLDDLPPKIEIDRACVLGARQKKLYDALALTLREAVKRKIEKRGLARSRISVLTAILRLRQMACDPRLVDPTASPGDSAKREAFLDLVRELVSEERRALVFSQFVELLGLWREDLDREGIRYEYLDGSSTDRDRIVERFRTGDAPLFLISLKAGGAGLNLVEADTVIHGDPWWNPAAIDQATDRAHRIGQTRPVTVVRLVAEGTIEDKIRMLEGKKRELAAAVIDAEAAALRGIEEAELDVLLGAAAAESEPEPEEEIEDAVVPGFLDAAAIDELRAVVRWLDRTGVPKNELAKKVGIPAARLSLLLIGHRVTMPGPVADRIRAIAAARGF